MGMAQSTDGLLIHYNFENQATDQTGNGNDGMATSLTYGEDRFGNPGYAAVFDGPGSVVELPDSTLWQHDTMTIALWFKTTTHGALIGYQNAPWPSGTNNLVPVGYLDTDGYVRGTLWSNTNTMTDSVVYTDDAWHLWTLVHDGTGQLMYIDGVLADTKSGQHNQLMMMNNQLGWSLVSGAWTGTVNPFYFNGSMDDFRFYDRALNATEVDELLNEPAPDTGGTNTGIFELRAHQTLVAWPNPSNGAFAVDASRLGTGQKMVQVYNTSGQLVHTQATTQDIVRFEVDFTPGLYLVKASAGEQSAITRIVVE